MEHLAKAPVAVRAGLFLGVAVPRRITSYNVCYTKLLRYIFVLSPKTNLQSIIRILYSYRRLFYMALAILLLVLSVGFITGMFIGIEMAAQRNGSYNFV